MGNRLARIVFSHWQSQVAPSAVRSPPTGSMLSLITIVDVLVLLSFGLALSAIRDLRRRKACPPGPRPLPIIGNLLDIPKESSWLAYAEFSKKYGEILSLASYRSV